APGHHHAAVDELPEGGGHDDPAFVVDAVLELAERHLAPWRRWRRGPLGPTAHCGCGPHGQPRPYHNLPPSPTLNPRQATCCGIPPTRAAVRAFRVLDACPAKASSGRVRLNRRTGAPPRVLMCK